MKRFEYDVVYMKTEVTDVSSQGAISHHVRKVLNAMGPATDGTSFPPRRTRNRSASS